jgi:hypothetical protein
LSAASSVNAAEPLYYSLYLELDQEYTDNLFATSYNKVKEMISYAGAGTTLEFKTEQNYLHLDYKIKGVFYYDIEDDDNVNTKDLNYTYHNLRVDASTYISSRFKIGLSEKYLMSRKPTDYYYLTNRISPAEFWNNRVSPYIEYQLDERIIFQFKYQYDVLDYRESFSIYDQDSSEHRGYLTLEYKLNPRNTAAFDLQYWKRDYVTFSSYQAYQAIIGFEREFNEIFSGEIRAGYQIVDYQKEQKGTVEDFQDPVLKISLTGKTEKSIAHLTFEQILSDIGDIGGSYYQIRRLSADLGHFFGEKLFIRLYGFYQELRYKELLVAIGSGYREKRKDTVWCIGTKIEYPIHKWATLALNFSHIDRGSNFTGITGDYTQNIVFLTINANYEKEK